MSSAENPGAKRPAWRRACRRDAVVLRPGLVLRFDELPAATVALDGVVLGRHLDPAGYRFSFDHHENPRFGVLSTCEQVGDALALGLDPGRLENVLVNDVDRDVAAAVWLLINPERAGAVRKRVTALGRTDSHGPNAPAGAWTPHLSPFLPAPTETPTTEHLWRAVEAVGAWLEGVDGPEVPARRDDDAFAVLCPEGREVPAPLGSAALYAEGFDAFVLGTPLGPARWKYTYAKRSDFVPYSFQPLLARLNELEPGWGGASTIGGSPREAGSAINRVELARLVTETARACR